MALIIKGKNKGKFVKLHQWCNDWFSVELEGKPIIVSPTMLQFSIQETYDITHSGDNGFLLNKYELGSDARFHKKRLSTSGMNEFDNRWALNSMVTLSEEFIHSDRKSTRLNSSH